MAKRKDWLRMAAALFMTAVVLLSCAGCVVIGNRKPIATLSEQSAEFGGQLHQAGQFRLL